jgi:hypothetical protein
VRIVWFIVLHGDIQAVSDRKTSRGATNYRTFSRSAQGSANLTGTANISVLVDRYSLLRHIGFQWTYSLNSWLEYVIALLIFPIMKGRTGRRENSPKVVFESCCAAFWYSSRIRANNAQFTKALVRTGTVNVLDNHGHDCPSR